MKNRHLRLAPPDAHQPCNGCGHTWTWRDDRGICQHELQDEDGTWMVCGCKAFLG